MVQFIQTGPSRRDLFREQAGQALGKGLSSFANNYFANKKLDEILNDESLNEAPPSERSSKIARALQGYGEEGINLLQNRMAIEQQREQEKQQKALSKAGKELLGIDISAYDPATQKAIITEAYKQKSKGEAKEQELNLINQLIGGKAKPILEKTEEQHPSKPIENVSKTSSEFDPTNISDEDLAKIAAINPSVSSALTHAKDVALREQREKTTAQRKEFEAERAYHTQFSKPAEEKANALRHSLDKQEKAMNYARQAIESKEVGAFTMNHIADVTGLNSLRNAKGAQLILASKEQLLPSLGRISAKAQNLYMEKRMASMIPQVGAKDEANLTMQEMLEGEAAMDRAYLTEFDRIAEKDMKDNGYVKKDIEKRAKEAAEQKEDQIAKRTQYRMRQIEEQTEGLSNLKSKVGKKVIQGTPLTLAMAKLYFDNFGDKAKKIAEENGYYIPSKEEALSFENRPEEFRKKL